MKESIRKVEWLVKGFFVKYVLGLILSKEKRFCTKIAKIFGISHDSVYKYLSNNTGLAAQFPDLMTKLAKHFHSKKNGWLIVDDTALSKIYAKYIEGVHWVYNSSLGKPEKGLCIVVIAWTNGDIIIPIGFDWWYSKEISPESHQTKIHIAQKLISKAITATPFKNLLADAAFISVDMIKFLTTLKVKFVTRIHSNRKVTAENGICEQLKNHPALKLNRNSRSKIVKVKLKDLKVYIVVFKRKKSNNDGYETVFLVTNINAPSSEIIGMYDNRWKIEPMFKTMKQSLGLMQCSSRSLDKQALHINAVFFGFAFIQYRKIKKKFLCSEDAIRDLQALKTTGAVTSLMRFCRNFTM